MFVRYRRDKNGKPVPHALVYTRAEHGIGNSRIDPDAIRIIERLKSAGHQAFIVGGAVRDLLQDRTPKDFDLVTDAIPAKIKKLFRNSRIIGKRFRLVHVFFGPKIIELSTFRSNANGSIGNEFGTMEEDVLRRDFTFNALYFDPTDGNLVDFVGGVKDIRAARVVPVIPLSRIFKEDPVRILRGIKYAAISGFSIPLSLRLAIRRDAHLLSEISSSRMTEEFFKILASGKAETIVRSLSDYRLFGYFVPASWELMRSDLAYSRALFDDLSALDKARIDANPVQEEASPAGNPEASRRALSVLLSHFLKSFVERSSRAHAEEPELFRTLLLEARNFLAPMNPPRVELEAAVLMIFRSSGISPLQRPPRSRRRRHSGHKKAPEIHPGDSPAPGGTAEPANT